MTYEALFKHVLFPGYETVRGRGTARYVQECDRNQWLAPAALRELQRTRLNALLAHCWSQVPFLKSYWGDHGLDPRPLGDVTELAAYPTITKAVISANHDGMIAADWRGRTLSKVTGGSTGDPFRFEYTMDSYARRTTAMWRGYGWAGAGLGTRTAYLWGTGMRADGWGRIKDRLYHGMFNRRFFDVFNLRESTIDRCIEEVRRYRPDAIVGYVAPLVLVARRMLETGSQLEGVRGVITGAEALYEPERRDIEKAFGCRAFNTYGAREVMLMAAECDHHAGLHVTSDHLVVETVDEQGRLAAPGVSGAVALTDLFNYGMPLVRYLNGDSATYATGTCPCGRGLPLLASVDGRVLDLIRAPDGRIVPGELIVVYSLKFPQIRKYQAVQTAKDVLQLRVALNRPLQDAERAQMLATLQEMVGPSMRGELAEVDDIPSNASGKRRISVSLQNLHMVPPLRSTSFAAAPPASTAG
jgi:phenylacetate-CoA ligase